MAPQIILGHSFFSQEDVQLASLIPNINDIELDSLESVLPLQSDSFTIKDVDNFTGFFEDKADNTFQALLAQIASWASKRTKQENLSLTAHKGRIYTLRKPTLWFQQLCEQAQVRTWLQDQIEDGNDCVYFVVGLHTLFDAATSEGLALESGHGGGIAVPVSNIPLEGIGSIELSASHERSRNKSRSCTVPGEQVFALRLKKVILRTWRTQDIANLRLSRHSHWIMASDNRSSGGDDAELLEAFLEGDSDGVRGPREDSGEDFGLASDRYDFAIIES
ncbi:hypothetical protein BJX68DRAFT_247691 [Aspergillus pseudodeflectus]|uniref:Uncharacterized protein n=1 Tax=Aspergillus pseudodeflectus TaxID=176178 RepID=A0ABR4JKS8_9EURO